MGTWSVKIDGNDTFQDVYQGFFEAYNQGRKPAFASKKVQEEFADMFADQDDGNHCLFALAFAQWETKSQDPEIVREVQEIIGSGRDLEVWKGLGADKKTLEMRKLELDRFLAQISKEREKPKRRSRAKVDFQCKTLLNLPAPDGQKTFDIMESFLNGQYKDTSSGISWGSGGAAVFYFYTQGKFVTAKWLDSQTLEILHDKTIQFAKKEETFYLSGDQGVIRYVAVDPPKLPGSEP